MIEVDALRNSRRKVFGVLGGMGPLSSAELLRTIYEYSPRVCKTEQEAPIVFLYSDPTFPDRTEAFLSGNDDVVLDKLIETLYRIREAGASKIVICCMTIHYLLPRLPVDLRSRIISPLDVIFAELGQDRKRHLLLCSTGTRKLRIFQNHHRWKSAEDFILLPEESDQTRVHELIYQIKNNRSLDETVFFVETMLSKYGVDSFIVGCSEIHLLAKRFRQVSGDDNGYGCVDPFAIIAKRLTEDNL